MEAPMTGKEFVQFHKQTVLRMNEICKAKNQDYSGGGNSSAFNNFTMVEKQAICSTEAGFLVRMTDKMSRIKNLINNGDNAVKDESISDTLMDLANYSILMMGYIQSKNGTAKIESEPTVRAPLPKKPATRVNSPANQKELLNQFLNPQTHEFGLVLEQSKKEAYRDGFKEGYNRGSKGEKVGFLPKLHVDSSVYGYASTLEIGKLDTPNGHLTILRDKNKWSKDADVTFVKITPLVEPKI